MKRVLVIGATGQVGRELIPALNAWHQPVDVVTASRSHRDPTRQLELERPETIERLVAAVAPDHIILTAAATNVAWCEENPEESQAINVVGTQATATAALRAGASLTFISTDYVFDGINGPYEEGEVTNPINVYGAHKLAAEAVVSAADPGNLVVRTCQVFGSDPRRINFVIRVADQLRRGERVEAAGDLYGTPTYAPDLARALIELTLARSSGVWHVAGGSFLSRYELARMVADVFGYRSPGIVEVQADQMEDLVNRPRRAGLLGARLASAGLRLITPLDQALAELAARDAGR